MIAIACPACGEGTALRGVRSEDVIHMTCGSCGTSWDRSLQPSCDRCGGSDVQAIPKAIVEKSRGTQLSVVGTRTVHLCSDCDAEILAIYHKNRPNPLMPDQLPTVTPEGDAEI